MKINYQHVGIVGAGAMGRGIAQIAAQAGSQVHLFDVNAAAVQQAHAAVLAQWDKLLEKGRIDAAQHQAYKASLQPAATLADLAPCDLVIEAAIERLDIKRKLVFPGILSDSLRKSSDDFKKAICGKVLEITEETECDDRVWDANNARWMRDPEDDTKFVSQKKRAFKFEPKASALNAADTDEAYKMLERYITEMYSEIAETVEK